MQIVLASASSRRRELLSCLLSDFATIPAKVDERKFEKLEGVPEELVVNLAKIKVEDVQKQVLDGGGEDSISFDILRQSSGQALRIQNDNLVWEDDYLIVAADTVVALGNKNNWEVIGKPTNKKEARDILKKLRGEMHKVFTGICVLQSRTGRILTGYVVSEVRFKNFSDKMMNDYIATGKPLDKAGAYGIQEIGKEFVEHLVGSFTNVMGLPVERLAELLKDFRVDLRRDWRKRVEILCARPVL